MRFHLLTAFSLLASLPGSGQDRLTLANEDVFLGKVVAFEEGLIKLKSPHAVAPLGIPHDKLEQLTFADGGSGLDQSANSLPKNSQQLTLKNGDRFPGQVIALNEEAVTFQTWFAGDLIIPRQEIEAIYFGVLPQRTVYQGPADLESWDLENNRSWRLQDETLYALRKSTIGKKFDLPENFIFRSTIGWDNNPNSRLYLCTDDSTVDPSEPDDCYRVQISSSAIEIQRIVREGGKKPEYLQLLKVALNFRSRVSKRVELELRVDRESQIIDLYLDGVKIAKALDPGSPPKGKGVVFESLGHTDGDMTVTDLSINEWDTKTQRLRLEPRAEYDLDTLSVDDGDRFSGQILSYDPTAPNESFTIKTTLSPEPVVIPLEHCAVLYFAEGPETASADGQYRINLRSGGNLTLSKITLNPETLTANHPWLGRLNIDRRVMSSITKSN